MDQLRFNVIICGAGIAGLSAAISIARKGHHVEILEEAKALSAIGVGVHVPPNSSRVMKQWGLLEKLERVAVKPSGLNFRRYANSEIIVRVPPPPNSEDAPYWSVHRADLQQILFEAATGLGCKLRLSARVIACDEVLSSVTLESGDVLSADLIVGADGIRSKIRQMIIPEENVEPIVNPLASYRATISGQELLDDPITAPILDSLQTDVWMGYSRHVIGYPIANGKVYNIAGTRPAKLEVGKWNNPVDPADVQNQFSGFDSIVQHILAKITDVKQYALAEVPRLPRWVSKSGRIVLLGDAAHAMLPFLAQGGAMAVEDGSAIGECIARAKTVNDIPRVLRTFERIRKWRCEDVQKHTRRNGEVIHLPDGEEREERDRVMGGGNVPGDQPIDIGPWLDRPFQTWLMNHDVIAHANKILDMTSDTLSSDQI